jgi:hypothetical protein
LVVIICWDVIVIDVVDGFFDVCFFLVDVFFVVIGAPSRSLSRGKECVGLSHGAARSASSSGSMGS